MIEQLLPAACHGMGIQVEKRREDGIAPVPEFNRFQARKQAALLFVEQAVKHQNRGFEVIGGDGERGGIGDQRDHVRRATGADLIFRGPRSCGGVQEPTVDLDAADPTLTHQIVQRILHGDVEPVGEFIGEPPLRRAGNPRLEGVHERAMPGKPHRVMRPQAVVVKAHELAERIEPPPMRVAGQISEGPQFAEDGQIGGRAQGLFQRG
ncbi:MAG: hypothetical protein ACRD15_04370 [Vicinamibacterales bacterium]